LGHPARVAILEYLLKAKSCICGDIVNELPLAQPTISQHLKELKAAGIIKGTVEGTSVCYCLDSKNLLMIQTFIETISSSNPQNQCC
jgi:DNA-binding transcriptional ArsR family regulator